MRQKGFVLVPVIIIIILLGIVSYFIYQNTQLQKSNGNAISPSAIPTVTSTPTPKPSITATPTSNPTPTPIIRSFEEEEKLMRKTLAGFEMYIGARNTAGALSFFTPPQTNSAKEKYENIRTKNLPYGLKSWSFVEDINGKLAVEELKGGYRVRINECKSNSDSCSLLFLELVRNDSTENGFSVDRYYTSAYAYQNNLGEEIKYQGFGF